MIRSLFGFGKTETATPEEVQETKVSLFDRMKHAVTRTRENLSERIEEIVSIGKEIDRETLDDLEASLIGADLGTSTTHEILERLRIKVDRRQIDNPDELKRQLKIEILDILNATPPRSIQAVNGEPEV